MDLKRATEIAGYLMDNEPAVLITMNENGLPEPRAMMILKREGMKTFYFSTNLSSQKVQNVSLNNKAVLYLFSKDVYTAVSLNGVCEQITFEAAGLDSSTSVPEGLNSNDYCVIKFTADVAEVYATKEKVKFPI